MWVLLHGYVTLVTDGTTTERKNAMFTDDIICAQPDGSIIDPYADRFEELLGGELLVSREVVRDGDHMIQEWAPERLIQALRGLLAHLGAE